MDTDALRLFAIAADLLNISAAGRQLGLSPAVAGTRLAKLERQVGAVLLHRSTRKVSLSLEGEAFLPYALEILAQQDAAFAALGYGRSEPTGTLRFAASSTFAQLYIAPVLSEFLDRYPKINLDLRFSDTQTNLIEGGYDLALRNIAIEDSTLIGRKLADDRRILCAAPSYLKAYGTPQTPDDLANHRILAFGNAKARTLVAEHNRACVFPPPESLQRLVCDDGAPPAPRFASVATKSQNRQVSGQRTIPGPVPQLSGSWSYLHWSG